MHIGKQKNVQNMRLYNLKEVLIIIWNGIYNNGFCRKFDKFDKNNLR